MYEIHKTRQPQMHYLIPKVQGHMLCYFFSFFSAMEKSLFMNDQMQYYMNCSGCISCSVVLRT